MSPADWRSSKAFVALETTLVVVLAASTLLRLVADLRLGVDSLWWGQRLAFADGLLRGVDVYPLWHSGVITGDVYGLVLAPFFAPAALVPTITGKLVAGQLSSLLVMLIPLAVLLLRAVREQGGSRARFAAAFVFLAGMLSWMRATNYQLTAIAADGPCLGFGMSSFVVLTGARRPSYGRLAAAAAFVALATLTKPNGAFMAVALCLVALYRGGVVKALVFGGFYAALTPAIALAIIHATGTTLAGVLFNDVTIPSSQFVNNSLRLVVRGIGKLTLPMFGLFAATALPIWLARRSRDERPFTWPVTALELWFVACVLVPISYLGRAKAGGDVNSFHAHYFAIAGTVFTWVWFLSDARYRPLRVAALSALSLLVAPFGPGYLWTSFSDNTHQRVFAYLSKHADAYFPWHSLATLEATGHYFHNSDGVYSRLLAQRAPTREEFMAHAPAHPSFIGLPYTGYRLPEEFVFADLVTRYYPDYALVKTPPPELATLGVQIFAPRAATLRTSDAR